MTLPIGNRVVTVLFTFSKGNQNHPFYRTFTGTSDKIDRDIDRYMNENKRKGWICTNAQYVTEVPNDVP